MVLAFTISSDYSGHALLPGHQPIRYRGAGLQSLLAGPDPVWHRRHCGHWGFCLLPLQGRLLRGGRLMAKDIAVEVNHVSKNFRLPHQKTTTVKKTVLHLLTSWRTHQTV